MITAKRRFPSNNRPEEAILETILSTDGLSPEAAVHLEDALRKYGVYVSKVALVLNKAQQENPERRYQTATEFAEDLAGALE